MKSLCFVVPSRITFEAFIAPHVANLALNHDITVVTDTGSDMNLSPQIPGVAVEELAISRKPALVTDLASLFHLFRFFRRSAFDVVITIHPKGGLLGITAAWLARVPTRVHWFTGQIWSTRRGIVRAGLWTFDFIVSHFATDILADSHSQARYLEKNRVVRKGKCVVLMHGSISGVDPMKFKQNKKLRSAQRRRMGIAPGAVVFGFLGRITREKGVFELVEALAGLRHTEKEKHIVWIGPNEGGMCQDFTRVATEAGVRSHFVGQTDNPAQWLSAIDVLVLPSHREGFGTAVIEAGSMGIPSITSDTYGLTESNVAGLTGLNHKVGNVAELTFALELLSRGDSMRARLGRNSILRTRGEFNQELVTTAFANFIQRITNR